MKRTGRMAMGLAALLLGACGGKTVVDGGGGGSAGGGGHTSTTTSTTTTTTTAPACSDLMDCCLTLCPKLEAMACWPASGECGCDMSQLTLECQAAVLPVYQCLLGAWPNAYQCIDHLPLLVCGYCETEIALYQAKCGQSMTCHEP